METAIIFSLDWPSAVPAALFLSAATSVVMAGIMLRRSQRVEVDWFAMFLLLCAVWSAGYALEMITPRLEDKMTWIKVEYVGLCLGPLFYAASIFRLFSSGRYPSRKGLFWLSVVPVLMLVAMCTNEWHGLMYRNIYVLTVHGIGVVGKERGPAYFVTIAYEYSLLLTATVAAARILLRHGGPVFRRQGLTLLAGMTIPWLANIVFVVRGATEIDFGPIAITFSALLLSHGLFRLGMFDLVPAARDAVFDGLRTPVLVVDRLGRVADVNTAARSLCVRDAVIGEPWQAVWGCLDGCPAGMPLSVDGRYRVTAGDRTYDLQCQPVAYGTGGGNGHGGAILTLHDVTPFILAERANHEREQALATLHQLKDTLFTIIAHDLRGPFNAVFGVIDTLRDEDMTAAERAELLERLSASSHSTLELLDNLLEWARFQSGRLQFRPEAVVMDEFLEEKLGPWETTVHQKRVTLCREVAPGVSLWADRALLGVIVHNLVSNALKFTPRGGVVTVGASVSADGALVWVRDTGIGMNEGTRTALFMETPVRSRPGTEGESGSGFGLVVCRDFAKRHGGRIEVESAPQKGTCFKVRLPPQNRQPSANAA